MRLALRILRPHSLALTLTLSLSHCLTVSLSLSLSLISLISFSSLSSLSPLSLSPLCLSSFRLSSLSSLAGGSGQRATYKGLFTPASKKSAVFFPTSLPSTFPFWSASFRPPLASSKWKVSGFQVSKFDGHSDNCSTTMPWHHGPVGRSVAKRGCPKIPARVAVI